jgi:hypothetical protein
MLFAAICIVESGGNPNARNAGEDAVGIAQIRPVMVRDCNRIAELRGLRTRWTLDDRTSVHKSWQMWWLYQDHYARDKSLEYKARIWNGGPSGHKKPATKPYWNKVEAELKGLEMRL